MARLQGLKKQAVAHHGVYSGAEIPNLCNTRVIMTLHQCSEDSHTCALRSQQSYAQKRVTAYSEHLHKCYL